MSGQHSTRRLPKGFHSSPFSQGSCTTHSEHIHRQQNETEGKVLPETDSSPVYDSPLNKGAGDISESMEVLWSPIVFVSCLSVVF